VLELQAPANLLQLQGQCRCSWRGALGTQQAVAACITALEPECCSLHVASSSLLGTGRRWATLCAVAGCVCCRRPKFVQHIRDESAANPHRKSEADSLIVEVLLEHGRLR
jgi:hypothetical protein